MPKPSQPATPNNFLHTLNTQPTPQLLTRSSVLQGHSRHPPNHTIFRSHKPLHIIHLHRPSFATIHKHPLYTHSICLSFTLNEAPLAVDKILKSLNFPQAHLTLALDASSAPPPFPITSPK